MARELEGYARLPEDLLQDLLNGAESVVEQVNDLLAPAIDARDELRAALEGTGLVRAYVPTSPESVCGVDGGFAVERTAAVDISLSVAVGVEGLTGQTTSWNGTQYLWWSRVNKHDIEVERLSRGVMIAQELAILRGAPHALRILDGSHLTLVIQLNSALTVFSEELRQEARRVWEHLQSISALTEVVRARSVVAMPKYDSSRWIADLLQKEVGREIPGDDKYLMGLLLQPGELLVPQQVPSDPWTSLHFDARPGDEGLAEALTTAIAPLRGRQVYFTYFKPSEASNAFRLEVKEGISESEIDMMCSTIASQITGPFVREPYPQYLADVMAKSVGLGLSALQSSVQLALSDLGRPEMAELLIRSYRTEGV